MQSLWQDDAACQFETPLALRVYTSRLLGQEPALVLHGGGNTSVKDTVSNSLAEQEEILYVKGSGWDLATIESAGFAPVKMDVLLKMAQLDQLTDSDMVTNQRAAMIDPSAPNPSVEAILHAIIPFKYVDHTHTDAVVTLTNTPDGERYIDELYGKRVFVIPYVMPGFALAKLVYEMTKTLEWQEIEGLVLMNHGLFTFADDAKTSYENTIRLVTEAEQFIKSKIPRSVTSKKTPQQEVNLVELAKIRALVSERKGCAQVAIYNSSESATNISTHENVEQITTRGPLTPDHVIRTKRVPIVFDSNYATELTEYTRAYVEYFGENRHQQTMLNTAPNFAVWKDKGAISFGKTVKEAKIIEDISNHTFDAILTAEQLSGYQALTAAEIFEVEYWELEQAKLKKSSVSPLLLGKVVLLTQGDSELGKSCFDKLTALGANVISINNEQMLSCIDKCQQTVDGAIRRFGGLDMVISLTDHPCSHQLVATSEQYLTYGLSPTVVAVNHEILPPLACSNIKAVEVNSTSSQTVTDIVEMISQQLLPC